MRIAPAVREGQGQCRRCIHVVHAAEVGLVAFGGQDHVARGQLRDGTGAEVPDGHGLMDGDAACASWGVTERLV